MTEQDRRKAREALVTVPISATFDISGDKPVMKDAVYAQIQAGVLAEMFMDAKFVSYEDAK